MAEAKDDEPALASMPDYGPIGADLKFDTGSSTLTADQVSDWWSSLNDTDRQTLESGSAVVVVHGHASRAGAEDANQALSADRAKAVANSIEDLGFEGSIECRSHGEDRARSNGEREGSDGEEDRSVVIEISPMDANDDPEPPDVSERSPREQHARTTYFEKVHDSTLGRAWEAIDAQDWRDGSKAVAMTGVSVVGALPYGAAQLGAFAAETVRGYLTLSDPLFRIGEELRHSTDDPHERPEQPSDDGRVESEKDINSERPIPPERTTSEARRENDEPSGRGDDPTHPVGDDGEPQPARAGDEPELDDAYQEPEPPSDELDGEPGGEAGRGLSGSPEDDDIEEEVDDSGG